MTEMAPSLMSEGRVGGARPESKAPPGNLDEVANVVLFLASDEAGFAISGAYAADGGWLG